MYTGAFACIALRSACVITPCRKPLSDEIICHSSVFPRPGRPFRYSPIRSSTLESLTPRKAIFTLLCSAALEDRAMEQSLGLRHGQQRRNLPAAARLAKYRHVVRIAAEVRDVIAHPFERGDDIQLADI